jgi:hypothetical protein
MVAPGDTVGTIATAIANKITANDVYDGLHLLIGSCHS